MRVGHFTPLPGLLGVAGLEDPFVSVEELEPKGELEVQGQEEDPDPHHLNEVSQVGGRLYLFRHRWGFSSWVKSIVSRGLGWSWIKGPPPPITFYQEPTQELMDYSRDLLQKGAFSRTKNLKFQGRLFSVPKKGTDKRRVILDLSRLNLYIRCDKFTTSIDLTDAYYHVPIARHFRPFLGFKLGKEAYSFKVMPFGLYIAPRVFTKLAEAVVQELRSQGILVVAYLDNWLIWEMDKDKCMKATDKVMSFLECKVQDQQGQVPVDSGVQVPVARYPLGLGFTHSFHSSREEEGDCQGNKTILKMQKDFEKESGENPRLAPVCLGHRRSVESQAQGHQSSLAFKGQCQVSGQVRPDTSDSQETSAPMGKGRKPSQRVTVAVPSPVPSGAYGRITDRLGRLFTAREGSGNLVTSVPKASYQHLGSYGSVSDFKKAPSSEEDSYQVGSRQCGSGTLYKQRWFKVKSCEPRDDSNFFSCSQEHLASISYPSGRSPQCSSRRTVSISPPGVRMVTGPGILQEGLQESTGSGSRSVCYRGKPQAALLRSPKSGPSGIRYGRPEYRLEPVEEGLFIPSSEPSPEGAAQVEILRRSGGSHSSSLAQEQLVSPSPGTRSSSSPSPGLEAVATSSNEDYVRFLRSSQNPNFMDFMKFAGLTPENQPKRSFY
ncbi:uncharacterized protein LOC135219001 [Macrobrachium nipponense]|uniref:uncharacterized protein LOC135219001 n=1 Tax=Macrobrachium nipponense TaxID=159736 RepID=UPI0030C872D2